MATVVMLAGVFQIAFGVLRLSRYVTQMPYTISGFMTIGLILIILQQGQHP